MSVLPTWLYVCYLWIWCPWKPEESIEPIWTGAMDGYESPCGESNPGPPKEQPSSLSLWTISAAPATLPLSLCWPILHHFETLPAEKPQPEENFALDSSEFGVKINHFLHIAKSKPQIIPDNGNSGHK